MSCILQPALFSFIDALNFGLMGVGVTGLGKGLLKLKKENGPNFLLPCGALNFGLTGLEVTEHDKGPLKLEKI